MQSEIIQSLESTEKIFSMKKQIAVLILIIVLLFLATISCAGGDGGDEIGSSGVQATKAANATATFGAEQFHLQLTAISDQEP